MCIILFDLMHLLLKILYQTKLPLIFHILDAARPLHVEASRQNTLFSSLKSSFEIFLEMLREGIL